MGLITDVFKNTRVGVEDSHRELTPHYSHGCTIYSGNMTESQITEVIKKAGPGIHAERGWAMLFGHSLIIGKVSDVERYIDDQLKESDLMT